MGIRKRNVGHSAQLSSLKFRDLPEAHILAECKSLLEACKRQGWLTYRRISTTGIPMGTRAGKQVFVRNEMQGMADLMVFLAPQYGCLTLHIEVKAHRGVLSEAQEKWRDELEAFGHVTYFVVRSELALRGVLTQFGLPCGVVENSVKHF